MQDGLIDDAMGRGRFAAGRRERTPDNQLAGCIVKTLSNQRIGHFMGNLTFRQ
jgi:hypothetical protein